MWLVAQILVSQETARSRVSDPAAAAVGAPRDPARLFPLRDDEIRIRLGNRLVEALVHAGLGRPGNRARVAGSDFVLLLTDHPRGYVATVAAARPVHLDAIYRLLREEIGRSRHAEREERILAISRALREPLRRVRRSVKVSLAGGGSLSRIEWQVGVLPPGRSFYARECGRIHDVEAAAVAVADLVRICGADRALPTLERYEPGPILADEGIEIVRSGTDPATGHDVEIVLLPRAGARSRMTGASFFRAAVASWRLDHPAAVSALSVGFDREGDRFFWVRQACRDAEPLGTRRLPLSELVRLAGALAELHDRDLSHRDVSAEKVLVDAAGAARLTGFARAEPARGRRAGLAADVRALVSLAAKDGELPADWPEPARMAALSALSPDAGDRPADARELLRALAP